MVIVSGVLWIQGSPTGKVFFGVTLISVIIFVLLDKLTEFKIKVPFRKNAKTNMILFSLSWVVLLIFNLVSHLKSYEIIRPFYVAAAADLETKVATFSVLQIENNPFLSAISTVFNAGILEPWGYRVVAVMLGAAFVFLILQVFFRNISTKQKLKLALTGGFICSTVLFVASHLWNGTYRDNPVLFVFAVIFSIVEIIIIYYLNGGFAASAGFHTANNFFALGWKKVLSGLWYGITSGFITGALSVMIVSLLTITFIVFLVNVFKLDKILKSIKIGWFK